MFISGLRTLSPFSSAFDMLFPEQNDRACDIDRGVSSSRYSNNEGNGKFMENLSGKEE